MRSTSRSISIVLTPHMCGRTSTPSPAIKVRYQHELDRNDRNHTSKWSELLLCQVWLHWQWTKHARTAGILLLSLHKVRRTLRHIKKASKPDGVPGRVLKHCAVELTAVLTDLLKISLEQASIPTCLKSVTIISVPNQSATMSFNDLASGSVD